jgi:hypothetical protein
MVASTPSVPAQTDVRTLHAGFLALLPRIERHGRFCFRKVNCPHQKAECLAEMTALAWQWYRSLSLRGKNVAAFPSALASYAAKAVRSGRRLCGQEKSKDVMSPLAQRRRGFAAVPIPNGSAVNGDVLEDALRDNTQSAVPEQAAFRLDFPVWVQAYDPRKRGVIEDLMIGERTLEVGKKHRLSPATISQMRRRFHKDWVRFCAPPVERRRVAAS